MVFRHLKTTRCCFVRSPILVGQCGPTWDPWAHFIWPAAVLWRKLFSIDLLYSVSASDKKSRCNTPESTFSLTFYNKTAGTLVSSRSVELQIIIIANYANMLSAYYSSDVVIFTPRMHQHSPFWAQKSIFFLGKGHCPLPQWGGGDPLPTSHPLCAFGTSMLDLVARQPKKVGQCCSRCMGFSQRNKIPCCRVAVHTLWNKGIRFRHPDYDPEDRAQKLISSSISQHLSTRNIWSKPMQAFLSNLAHRQTNKHGCAGENIYLLPNNVTNSTKRNYGRHFE